MTVPVLRFTDDEENDGVMVLLDDEVVWQEQSFASIDQFLRFRPNQDQPVILKYGPDDA